MSDTSRASGLLAESLRFAVPENGAAWAALTQDSGAAVLVADRNGTIKYCNAEGALMLGAQAQAVVGRTLADLFSREVAAERTAFCQTAAACDRAFDVDGIVRGRWMRCAHRAVQSNGETVVVMVFSMPAWSGAGAESPRGGALVARYNDSGPLGALTSREIDVLRLIAEGLSTAEIATELHRSVKTIEWHRVSLGTKLGQTNRVGLARVAIGAGLAGLERSSTRPQQRHADVPGRGPARSHPGAG